MYQSTVPCTNQSAFSSADTEANGFSEANGNTNAASNSTTHSTAFTASDRKTYFEAIDATFACSNSYHDPNVLPNHTGMYPSSASSPSMWPNFYW